jgi:hypothetical protein
MIQRVILLSFALGVFLLAVRRLRRYRLKERYTLLFMFLGLPILVLAIWPRGIGWIGEILHIQYTTVSLMMVTALGVVMVLEFLTIVSLQDRKIAALAQIVGILMEKQGMNDHDSPGGGRGPSVVRSAPTGEPKGPGPQESQWEDAPARRMTVNVTTNGTTDRAGKMAYDVAGSQSRE